MKSSKIILGIIAVFMIALLMTYIGIDIYKDNKEKYEQSHNYIETTVVDKYFTEGYGFGYGYYPPSYTIVTEQILSDGSKITWTNAVNQYVYNSYNIGDILIICESHNEILEEEESWNAD